MLVAMTRGQELLGRLGIPTDGPGVCTGAWLATQGEALESTNPTTGARAFPASSITRTMEFACASPRLPPMKLGSCA